MKPKKVASVRNFGQGRRNRHQQLLAARRKRSTKMDLPMTADSNLPVNVAMSASEKKFRLHGDMSRPSADEDILTSKFIIVDASLLSDLVEILPCPECQLLGLQIMQGEKRFGFSSELLLCCSDCNSIVSRCETSRKVGYNDPSYEVNKRVVTSMIDIGVGYAGMQKFSAIMGMECLHQRHFVKHSKKVSDAVEDVATECLEMSSQIIRKTYNEMENRPADYSDVIDIAVSFDGSWFTRGHTSNFGVGVVIELLTGLVIDFEVMSKYCHGCSILTDDFKASENFLMWKEEHNCDKNFSGSSGAMEPAAAEIIWRRSLEKYKFRYITMLSDGDAKTFLRLNELKIYGEEHPIEKEECVNHVAKRMGTALRKITSEYRSQGVTLGGRGYGKLTQETIRRLTLYYQRAIHSNLNDTETMRNAIYATLFHALSTDDDPHHCFCPNGPESWCFYNRAISVGKEPERHADKVGTPLSREVGECLLPIYKRLSDEELLKRCLRGKTQNANESLHSVIWNKCPKVTFMHKRRIETGVGLAVAHFNRGRTSIVQTLSKMGISPGLVTTKAAKYCDLFRLSSSAKRCRDKNKSARKMAKLTKLRAEVGFERKEGTSYESGGF